MAEILPRHVFYGFIIFTIFIAAGITFLSGLSGSESSFYKDSTIGEFNNSMNKMVEVNSQVAVLKSNLTSSEKNDFGLFGVLNSLIQSTWIGFKGLFTSFSFMLNIFTVIPGYLGIPGWVAGLIISMVVMLFIFAIWSALLQKEV